MILALSSKLKTEFNSSAREEKLLYRWIYTVSVFRPSLSVFLRYCFSVKNYALFHPHFCKSISALSRLLHIHKKLVHVSKNFVYERFERYFKIKLYPFTKNFFGKLLSSMWQNRRSQDFWLGGGGQTTNHMQWRHQKFSKKELFCGQRYRRMEDLKP